MIHAADAHHCRAAADSNTVLQQAQPQWVQRMLAAVDRVCPLADNTGDRNPWVGCNPSGPRARSNEAQSTCTIWRITLKDFSVMLDFRWTTWDIFENVMLVFHVSRRSTQRIQKMFVQEKNSQDLTFCHEKELKKKRKRTIYLKANAENLKQLTE
ncbi:unnamed protein product [Notodromas monacha]|uniref:Uncharacterized protein n=1 Tax=Notodromas monacha TaxID=399045 RepID=A0A7R9BTI3_9CRUS|nr:unnamed protein product [Notodromas monacha]CAG0921146.1 unnamed protein product [Notodromas monacha]